MTAKYVERVAAELLKLLVLFAALAAHDVSHFGQENKGRPFTVEAQLRLEISEKVSEIDVKEVPSLFDHDVICVSVTDSEYERGNAVSVAFAFSWDRSQRAAKKDKDRCGVEGTHTDRRRSRKRSRNKKGYPTPKLTQRNCKQSYPQSLHTKWRS